MLSVFGVSGYVNMFSETTVCELGPNLSKFSTTFWPLNCNYKCNGYYYYWLLYNIQTGKFLHQHIY